MISQNNSDDRQRSKNMGGVLLESGRESGRRNGSDTNTGTVDNRIKVIGQNPQPR